jgi:tetratricopeptide (TPR) repeat protein
LFSLSLNGLGSEVSRFYRQLHVNLPHYTVMSESKLLNTVDPVVSVWHLLRDQGFDAAVNHASTTLQLRAEICMSAGQLVQSDDELSVIEPEPADGTRYARIALFSDALGNSATARRYSEQAVSAFGAGSSIGWINWLINQRALSATAAMLRAYEELERDDSRAPWWLASTLANLPGDDARAERRAALERTYARDPAIDQALPLQLAIAYRESRDWNNLERISREVLSRDPADIEMAWQLSHAQWQRDNDAAAAEATMRAVNAAAPGNSAVVAAIGLYLSEQGRYRDSEAILHASLTLDPGNAQAASDLAELQLRRDFWSAAWPRFEGRLATDDREADNVVRVVGSMAPRWQGESLAGKTLLVYSEKGSGDDIQMVRFIPALAARVGREGGTLKLAVRRPLQPLFVRLYEHCIAIEDQSLGTPDYVLAMMSVPHAIRLRRSQVHGTPYLIADAHKVETWRERLSANGSALHVGLAWNGSPLHRRDAKRSIALAALAPILAMQNVVFYPLTPGRPNDVTALLERGYRVCDLTAQYTDGFDDVAAHVTALDATVTIDSAPLHLGGALGRPVFAMLDHVSHWCWRDAEAQPWYDSVELFRQPKPGEWAPVVERVVARLGAMADQRIHRIRGRDTSL